MVGFVRVHGRISVHHNAEGLAAHLSWKVRVL
jgi:hypothetical protein